VQSIWSTTSTFGYRNLAYVMVAIGLLTYIIVFNLNRIVKLGKSNYQSLKSGMVHIMQADKRETWRKGELFHKYRPRANAEQPKPSEWWILVYFLQRALCWKAY
jgi:hypothetical protein